MNKQAVTLVELIVSMTIAMMLMVSIGVFVSSGMQNLFLQQKSLQNMSDVTQFSAELSRTINFASNSGSISKVGSGIVFKRESEYDYGGFAYIGTLKIDKLFCEDDILSQAEQKTNHIFIKNFIPYFEQGENKLEDTLTSKTGNYTSNRKEHTITENGNIIIGKGIFGSTKIPKEGILGTKVFLNNPTGIEKDNFGNLYFSDTLNNRVLYLSGTQVFPLLDFDDGLKEPTGLYFDEGEKALYISNSGKGEILKLSSKKENGSKTLEFSFSPKQNISNIAKLSLSFKNTQNNVILNLPSSKSNFSFSANISQNEDFLTGSVNNLEYYFSDYSKELDKNTIYDCPAAGDIVIKSPYLESGIVKKQVKKCPNSGTGKTITYGSQNNLSFTADTKYSVVIHAINFTNTAPAGNYYIQADFQDSNGDSLFQQQFPFITNGDNNITTLSDNTLEIQKEGLQYPSGIWGTSDTDFNEFKISEFSDFILDTSNDTYLETPVKKLDISKNGSIWNFILKYYRNFDCYEQENNEGKIRTYLIKKYLK